MPKASSLLLLVAHVLIMGAPQRAAGPPALSGTTLGRGAASGPVVHAVSKTPRSAAVALLAARLSRGGRPGSGTRHPPRTERAASRPLTRSLAAASAPALVLRI
jgi:hypothetical protein